MVDKFVENGIVINNAQKDAFEEYYKLLVYYNEKFNITAVTDREDVIKKHFIDSALGVKYVGRGELIDVGSGGGFPAIPLKLINDNINVTMLEATGKKCEFLKEVVKTLKLNGVTVINGRAEDYAKNMNYREKFDICTARAVARLNTLCEYCMPFVKVGGKFLSFKGEIDEELKESENAVNILGGKINVVDKYSLYDAKRSIVVIDKIKPTDKKYPRGNGKERKNPL